MGFSCVFFFFVVVFLFRLDVSRCNESKENKMLECTAVNLSYRVFFNAQ